VLTRDASRISAEGVDVVVADLRDTPAVERAMTGCDVVVLAAHGFVGPRGISPETIDRDATIAVIERAAASGVGHIVLVSAHGAAPDHPMSLHRAKFAAERALKASALNASSLTWTIIRPTPFLETWTGIIGAHVADRRQAVVFGRGENPIDFVPVGRGRCDHGGDRGASAPQSRGRCHGRCLPHVHRPCRRRGRFVADGSPHPAHPARNAPDARPRSETVLAGVRPPGPCRSGHEHDRHDREPRARAYAGR
jgi:hypothetical protein